MNKTKFVLDKTGVRTEILQAEYMLNHISQVAETQGEVVKTFIGFDRAKAIVKENEK